MEKSKRNIAIPPGETIKEQLKVHEMNQKQFAVRMGLSEKHVSRLINGKVELTHSVALKLEMVLGPSAEFWDRLESLYQSDLLKVKADNNHDAELKLAREFPYDKLMEMNWVPQTRDDNERLINLKKFFEVAELNIIFQLDLPGISSEHQSESDFLLASFAQKLKLQSRNKDLDRGNWIQESSIKKMIDQLSDRNEAGLKIVLNANGMKYKN
jgi:HTH-type transcriptional regulator/antitoxin HigA